MSGATPEILAIMNELEENLIYRMQDLMDQGFSSEDAFDISNGNKTMTEVVEERMIFTNLGSDMMPEEGING